MQLLARAGFDRLVVDLEHGAEAVLDGLRPGATGA